MYLERIDPLKQNNKLVLDHYARYLFATNLVRGKRVLDVACGLGYGTKILANAGAKSVVGVDVSEQAIEYAKAQYRSENIQYICSDALALNADSLGLFDVIVSFETLEHVVDPEALLNILKSLLSSDGVLVVSVPNDIDLGVENPYHLSKFTYQSFNELLDKIFQRVRPYYQNYVLGSMISKDLELRDHVFDNIDMFSYSAFLLQDGDHNGDIESKSDCFVAVCSSYIVFEMPPINVQSVSLWREIDKYLIEVESGRKWLDAQYQTWREVAEQRQQAIRSLHDTIEQLSNGKLWLEQQVHNFRAENARAEGVIAEQKLWIEQLEEGQLWLSEQRENLLSEVSRMNTHIDELKSHIKFLEQSLKH